MDYNTFITKYRKNPDYQAEQEIKQKRILEEEQTRIAKEKASESHPQPFTILWLDDECKDNIEVFFAMNVKDAKKYVKQNYSSKLSTYGVFYGESTADENLAFNEDTINNRH